MSEGEILLGLLIVAGLMAAVGWVLFGLALLRHRNLIEEADKLACRVVDQGEELARLRHDLREAKLEGVRARQLFGAMSAPRKVWPGPSTGEEGVKS